MLVPPPEFKPLVDVPVEFGGQFDMFMVENHSHIQTNPRLEAIDGMCFTKLNHNKMNLGATEFYLRSKLQYLFETKKMSCTYLGSDPDPTDPSTVTRTEADCKKRCWLKVQHLPKFSEYWHRSDNFAGTLEYGDPNDAMKPWAIKYDHLKAG